MNHKAIPAFISPELNLKSYLAAYGAVDSRLRLSKEVTKLRELAADIINESLKAANSDIRVDHRSFKERGIEQEPTIHLGPKASGQERRGEATRAGDYNRHVEQYNELLKERRELGVAIDQERDRLASPAQDREDAQERTRAAAEPFSEAIATRGAVPDIQADGLTWWQRAVGRIVQARELALKVAVKALEYWRQRAQEPGELGRVIGELER